MEYRYEANYFDTKVVVKYDSLLDNSESINSGIKSILEFVDLTFSFYRPDSQLSQLNISKQLKANDDFIYVLNKALFFSNYFNGIYDLSIAPLSQLFLTDNTKDIHTFDKSFINYQAIKIIDDEVLIHDNQELDFGSIAKGHAADLIKQYLINNNCLNAIINLGGNILCFGSSYNLAITNPNFNTQREQIIVSLNLKDLSLVTSGISERYYLKDNAVIHHIINPTTMQVLDNELLSVSVITPLSIDADALATACLLSGTVEGIRKLKLFKDTYGIFITKDGKIILSDEYLEYLITGVEETYTAFTFNG